LAHGFVGGVLGKVLDGVSSGDVYGKVLDDERDISPIVNCLVNTIGPNPTVNLAANQNEILVIGTPRLAGKVPNHFPARSGSLTFGRYAVQSSVFGLQSGVFSLPLCLLRF